MEKGISRARRGRVKRALRFLGFVILYEFEYFQCHFDINTESMNKELEFRYYMIKSFQL